jgi:hypothetical protein
VKFKKMIRSKLLFSKLHVFLITGLLLFSSCIDRQEYPLEPFIEFSDFFIVENHSSGQETGVIVIGFTDGDGDIGLESGDTLYPYHPEGDYYDNYIMNILKKQGNDTVRLAYNLRIPPVNPDDYPQNLSGGIYIDIPIDILRITLPDNKFQFEAFIYDRALNKSNMITSPVFLLP